MTIELKELLNDIEECRARMVHLASRTSMIDHNVVEASTQLDTLINRYFMIQKRMNA